MGTPGLCLPFRHWFARLGLKMKPGSSLYILFLSQVTQVLLWALGLKKKERKGLTDSRSMNKNAFIRASNIHKHLNLYSRE